MTKLAAIPVDFVVNQGLQEHTEAKRRPYAMLIRNWAAHEGVPDQGEVAASQLNLGKEPKLLTDLQNLPNSVAPRFRKGEKAELLVKIVRDIDAQMKNDSNWKWALVMRVMLDEGIIMVRIPNKFDELICSMIPGKGRDTVRKNGNYNVLDTKRSWRNWIEHAGVDRDEAQNRMVCEEIYGFLKPLLEK